MNLWIWGGGESGNELGRSPNTFAHLVSCDKKVKQSLGFENGTEAGMKKL